ncbi:hypothetical protein PISMIDRAFT_14373 [Pisolithus microcarpus 441]|uniref:Uncharacterized protein n=1 Tax=Pisolithus microcarpus 441 TaxID=765257 RepID=A0A0C9YX51_9AGAM|nr:hypothetical protein PISMIDRAFT_14373 [Pisolithus microcarpus 441]
MDRGDGLGFWELWNPVWPALASSGQEFATMALLYDLPHNMGVEGRSSGGKPPVQDDGPEEGKMRDEPAPM